MLVHDRAPGSRRQPVPWIPSGPWPDPCIPNRPYTHVMNSPTVLTSFVVSMVLVTEYLLLSISGSIMGVLSAHLRNDFRNHTLQSLWHTHIQQHESVILRE